MLISQGLFFLAAVACLLRTVLSVNIKDANVKEEYDIQKKSFDTRIFISEKLSKDKNMNLVFYVKSKEDFTLKVFLKQKQVLNCFGNSAICVMYLADLSQSGGLVSGLDLQYHSHCQKCKAKLQIAVQDHVETEANNGYQIFTDKVDFLRILLNAPNLEDYKKFRADIIGHSKNNSVDAIVLSGAGNFNSADWPKDGQNDFLMGHLHRNELGFTMYSEDPNFCSKATCKYKLVLSTEGLWKVDVDFRYSSGLVEEIVTEKNYVGSSNRV